MSLASFTVVSGIRRGRSREGHRNLRNFVTVVGRLTVYYKQRIFELDFFEGFYGEEGVF